VKATINTFVHYERNYKNEIVLSAYPFSMASTGKVLIGEQTIEVSVPDDFDPVAEEIKLLKAEREKLEAETRKRITRIDDEIAKRLAIGYEPTASSLVEVLNDGIPF
jgi:hypothetical protein